tara:strand:- start:175 stop:321 length:147 start_codon:yes stop_codon:yes gene_type:complete
MKEDKKLIPRKPYSTPEKIVGITGAATIALLICGAIGFIGYILGAGGL